MRALNYKSRHPFLRLFCLITTLMLFGTLAGCSAEPYSEGDGKLKIVATGFIPFDFARQITGSKATVTVLQTDGGDLHDFVPTTASLKALADADIFICLGGASDGLWIEDAVKASENKDLTVVKLTELVSGELAELEGHNYSEFCENNHSHNEHDHGHSANDGHGHMADEHIWTSPKNAIAVVTRLAEIFAERDSANAELYKANTAAYVTSLGELDAKYTDVFSSSQSKTLVFADRFPFIYLIKDYGACYFAAFGGCEGETDADFETAVKLTQAVNDNALNYVIVTESSDKKLAKSISDATGCDILTLSSMQSVSRTQIKDGITYLSVMEANLTVLKTALI